MRKVVYIVAALALVLFLFGCASTSKVNQDGSPSWTTKPLKDSWGLHYGVGSALQSTEQLSRLRAESAAKDAIARWAETTVDNSLVSFIQEAGEVMRTKQMLEVLESMSVQTVSIALRGVEVVDRYLAPDGTVWVLSSYPIKNLKEAYRLKSEELERASQAIQAKLLMQYLEVELAKAEQE
jgi:hypothetical protein